MFAFKEFTRATLPSPQSYEDQPEILVIENDGSRTRLFSDGTQWVETLTDVTLSASTGAASVGFDPAGAVAATDVQAAIEELDTDKVAVSALAASTGAAGVGFIQSGTGAAATNLQTRGRKQVFVTDFSTPQQAVDSLTAGGEVFCPAGTYTLTSQLVVPAKVTLRGVGYATEDSVLAADRGATCFVRGFTGSDATILLSGDSSGLDMVDVDNNLQGTGECVQVTGTRVHIGAISTRNSGGDGTRIGKTEAGASSINCNFWQIDKLITCGNTLNGLRVDHTNTSTSLSYPLGATDANAGYCALLDARGNGEDGLQIGNANDNVFAQVGAQGNTGCGIHFKTDGTNAGPRCNTILHNDSEGNTGNDIQIDAATLPAAAPGLYNKILGNRSVAVSSRIVDNSTGSYVLQWNSNLNTYGSYHAGSNTNVVNGSGQAGFNGYFGGNLANFRLYGLASGSVDTIMRGAVRKNGASLTDGWELNQHAVFQPLNEIYQPTYSTSITIDASTGHIFEITANDGVAFAINAPTNPYTGETITVVIRNTSGGALGTITWNAAFKMAAFTSPATGFSRSSTFYYNGTNWIQTVQSAADVPN